VARPVGFPIMEFVGEGGAHGAPCVGDKVDHAAPLGLWPS
jgi:hypothetical protein